jgi:geranylgeranyl diphosphate synthase type I
VKLEALRTLLAPQILEVEDALVRYFERATDPPGHYGIIRYHLGYADEVLRPLNGKRLARGKRLRPILCMLIGRAIGVPHPALVRVMLAAELMHNASIVHDDIQDQEELRWGRATVWTQFGVGQAINVGDALIGYVYDLLLTLREDGVDLDRVLRVVQTFNRAHIRMAEGQHLDLANQGCIDITVPAYLDVISRKTAAACECIAHAAAILAERAPELEEAYREFGHAYGMLYQICDDLNSIWKSPGETGKQPLGDLVLRKATLPLLYGLTLGSPALREVLLRPVDGAEALSLDEAEFVQNELTRLEVDKTCKRHAIEYRDRAIEQLRSTRIESSEHKLLESMVMLTAQVAGVPPQ